MDYEELFRHDGPAETGSGTKQALADSGQATASKGGATAMFGVLPADERAAFPSEAKLDSPAAEPVPLPSVPDASAGFTQLLRALRVEPTSAQVDAPAMTGPTHPPASKAEAGPLTQLLRTISTPEEPGSANVAPPVKGSEHAPVTSFQVTSFKRPETEAVPEDAAINQPSSFTQLFSNLAAQKTPVAAAPDAGAMPSFTQMFATLEPEQAGEPPLPKSSPELTLEAFEERTPDVKAEEVRAPIQKELAASTGQPSPRNVEPPTAASPSFTQMFQTLQAAPQASGETVNEAPKPNENPGSFTQLFSTIAPASPAAQLPARPSAPPSDPGERAVEDQSVSRVFAAYRPEAYQAVQSPLPPPIAPPPASVGLTQLLRALDQPLAPAAPPPFRPHEPAGPPQPSGFTGVYRELAAPAMPAAQPAVQPPMPVPPAGPSEYTLILNASAVRESALKGGEGASNVAPAPPAQGASAPWTLPAAPKPPEVKLPEIKLPSAPKPGIPAAPGSLQQYVPLLLILVIFLLLAILVAVVFLMKK